MQHQSLSGCKPFVLEKRGDRFTGSGLINIGKRLHFRLQIREGNVGMADTNDGRLADTEVGSTRLILSATGFKSNVDWRVSTIV